MARSVRKLFWFAPALALLAGCVMNPYKRNYTTQLSAKVPHGEVEGFLPSSLTPKLLSSTSIAKDAVKLLEQGYFPIGRSVFREQLIDGSAALEEAKEVGADLVLVKQEHAGTGTYSVPVGDWTPDRSITTTEAVRTENADGTGAQISQRQSTTVIAGEYETHYELQTVEYYDHTAVYWRKVQPPRFGVYVSEMEDADRQAIQSNKGVVVRAVINGSPAFLGDLFRDDILRSFGSDEILGVDDFLAKVAASAGKEVELRLWRNGQDLTKTVKLNAR